MEPFRTATYHKRAQMNSTASRGMGYGTDLIRDISKTSVSERKEGMSASLCLKAHKSLCAVLDTLEL